MLYLNSRTFPYLDIRVAAAIGFGAGLHALLAKYITLLTGKIACLCVHYYGENVCYITI